MDDLDTHLREPANRASSRAVLYWRALVLPWPLALGVAAAVGVVAPPSPRWWAVAVAGAGLLPLVALAVCMPPIRYRVHRWEVTRTSVHTRAGWVNREARVAPLSRVQTVDTTQSALMRLFGLASVTVTTASAAGPITIECLDADIARRTVAELTAYAVAARGDEEDEAGDDAT